MRVAVVYPVAFGPRGYFGGGERYPLEFARAMAGCCSCEYLTFGTRSPPVTDAFGLVHTTLPVHLRGSSQFDPVSASLLRHIGRFDVFHFFSLGKMAVLTALAARPLGRHVVATPVGAGGRAGLYRLRFYRLLSGVLPISEYSRRQEAWMALKPNSVIYGGCNPACFTEVEPRWPRPKRVLYVGRVTPHKGVDVLIRALPAEAELIVCGQVIDEEYSSYLRQLAEDKRVRFDEKVDDRSLASYYGTSAVCVLPSVPTDYLGRSHLHPELLGLVLLEAMWHGTPVIASRTGALPEIVDNGQTGYLVDPGDVADLHGKLTVLMTDPGLAQTMGERAKRSVSRRFTWQAVARSALEFYRTL